ncbi:MAG: 2,3-epoxybenzoyl-CoA dihydrolase [Proteobacteria bacterium]|nr:2,3-epoxybenzoyl-CoA dihydrolase [Pseudomonadota bacterium]
MIQFDAHPALYRHWRLTVSGTTATLLLKVDENAGLFPGYELKQNSYDLGVDIELRDAVTRLRFEHPCVNSVVITGSGSGSFCAGANIRMLAGASHHHKVNFCKFTNETRNDIEDASAHAGQRYVAALNGTAAGGGYELALACDHIVLLDDGFSAVSFPELPLLAVLPGTGGLTRLVDKRHVRRDLADHFATHEEGERGQGALNAGLIDATIPRSQWEAYIQDLCAQQPLTPDKPAIGINLEPLTAERSEDRLAYGLVTVDIQRETRIASISLSGPAGLAPQTAEQALLQGANFWPLQLMRELDDALLHLRFNEPLIGTIVIRTSGDSDLVSACSRLLNSNGPHWFINEVRHLTKRVLQRLDLTSRSIFTLVEPGSCFHGVLAELLFAADQVMMLQGVFEEASDQLPAATISVDDSNFGTYPMVTGISRLEARFWGDPEHYRETMSLIGRSLDAQSADQAGLITRRFDDLDWEDEIRLILQARASFSPDALTGLEANLRFPGPETMQSKIFARLSAWQNWIFQRTNATGAHGALPCYGTGERPVFDMRRV